MRLLSWHDTVLPYVALSVDRFAPRVCVQIEERERLLQDGFSNWSRRDFNAFVRSCEKYGRDSLSEIASEVEGKTEAEVRAYAKTFWKRTAELADEEKIIKTIEKGEHRIQRQQDIMNAIATKLERYKNPMVELKIQVRGVHNRL